MLEQINKLRSGEIKSIDIDYDDSSYTELFVFLSMNTDICFDGISLTLCNQQV